MSECAIELQNVTKQFKIPLEPTRSLKDAFIKLASLNPGYRIFTALEDVSFSIQKGEAVGIIGANGSGKSTLFKIISHVLRPTLGTVGVDGKISPLIELSAGFHPDLTGMENIQLNGAIYGMSREMIAEKVPAIREFADIGDFFFSPVRTYSSGMMARLAFALAVNVDAKIILCDEVLAVGDQDFQNRCLDKIQQLKRSGVTIAYVSHDMKTVESVCERTILLRKGRIVDDGPADRVTAEYVADAQ